MFENLKKAYEEGKEKGKQAGSFEGRMQKLDDAREAKKEAKKELEELKKGNIPYCPKCFSKSISFAQTRGVSVGKAIVGNALLGAPGAVLGGLSSKKVKGKNVCMNCGHTWKPTKR